MNLESITARVRPRMGWEAIGLGVRMVQTHFIAVYRIWFVLTLLPFAIAMAAFGDHLGWVVFGFWWIRPVFETAILNYISKAVFDEYPSVGDTLKQFHRFAFKQWFAQLTWRRFSTTRSLDLPVTQLEQLSGTRRSRRISTLHAFNAGAAIWLTLFFTLLQFIFYLNLILLCLWVIPDVYLTDVEQYFVEYMWTDDSPVLQHLQAFAMYLVMSLLAPFYVAAGFAIYINQRTILEAWDIELTFKKLAQRLAEKQMIKRNRATAAGRTLPVVLLCCLVALASTDTAYAQEEQIEPTRLTHEEARKRVEAIRENPPFKREKLESSLIFDFDSDSEQPELEDNVRFQPFSFDWLALLFELMLWAALIIAIVYILFKLGVFAERFSLPQSSSKTTSTSQLFGLDVTPDSLPENPDDVAWQLWQSGKQRAALSLLLRATISQLITRYRLNFEDGYTELECARLVATSELPTISKFFNQLIHTWRRFAYGHRSIADEDMKHLCDQWPITFRPIETTSND